MVIPATATATALTIVDLAVITVAALSIASLLAVIKVVALAVIVISATKAETTAICSANTMAMPPFIMVILDPPTTMVSLGRGAMNSLLLHQETNHRLLKVLQWGMPYLLQLTPQQNNGFLSNDDDGHSPLPRKLNVCLSTKPFHPLISDNYELFTIMMCTIARNRYKLK
jgi:hypothetical protein